MAYWTCPTLLKTLSYQAFYVETQEEIRQLQFIASIMIFFIFKRTKVFFILILL